MVYFSSSFLEMENRMMNLKKASITRRFLAMIMDGLILLPAMVIYQLVFQFAFFENEPETIVFILFFTLTPILFLTIIWLYFITLQKKLNGQTLGKKLLSIRVRDRNGKLLTTKQLFLREIIGKFVSINTLYIGYFLALGKSKRALHDRVADTIVVSTSDIEETYEEFNTEEVISNYKTEVKKSWLYVIPVLVFLVTIVGIVLFVIQKIEDMNNSLYSYVMPGQHEIVFEEPGTYELFYEYQSVINNQVYNTGEDRDISGLGFWLETKDTQELITLDYPSVESSYTFSNKAGYSIFEFEIVEPGTYLLTAEYDENVEASEIVVAIDYGLFGGFVVILLGSLGLLLVGVVLSLVIAYAIYKLKKKENM